jgi:hypothetical protein
MDAARREGLTEEGTTVTRGFLIAAGLALVLGVTGPALAQDKSGDAKKAGTSSTQSRRVDGVVKSVQPDGFVVSGKEQNKERDWAFAITDRTTMRHGTKQAGPDALKPGVAVAVNYIEQDGKVIAQTVTVKDDGTGSKK